jgi:hypothetical protein
VVWIVRLVRTDTEGEERCNEVMAFERPNGLCALADPGLTLAQAKQLLAAVQQQMVRPSRTWGNNKAGKSWPPRSSGVPCAAPGRFTWTDGWQVPQVLEFYERFATEAGWYPGR